MTVLISLGERRTIDDQYVSEHMVVNIASNRNDSAVLKRNRRVLIAFVHRQNKFVGMRERVDVMSNRIAVRKFHRGHGLYDEQVRHKLPVYLVHDGAFFWGRQIDLAIQPERVYGNIADTLPTPVNNDYVDVTAECRCCEQQRKEQPEYSGRDSTKFIVYSRC